jgi:hypothetical protein
MYPICQLIYESDTPIVFKSNEYRSHGRIYQGNIMYVVSQDVTDILKIKLLNYCQSIDNSSFNKSDNLDTTTNIDKDSIDNIGFEKGIPRKHDSVLIYIPAHTDYFYISSRITYNRNRYNFVLVHNVDDQKCPYISSCLYYIINHKLSRYLRTPFSITLSDDIAPLTKSQENIIRETLNMSTNKRIFFYSNK